jgi:hypothetical protein
MAVHALESPKMGRVVKVIPLIALCFFTASCVKPAKCTNERANDVSFKFAQYRLPNQILKKDAFTLRESTSQLEFGYYPSGGLDAGLGGGIFVTVDRSTCRIVGHGLGQ